MIIAAFVLMRVNVAKAQTVSDFENLTLAADSFWNGSDLSGGFASGNAFFPNTYDTSYSIWSAGFAYSNMKDSTTAGYTNMYSARTASGAMNSANYAIGQQGTILRLTGYAAGKVVSGLYVTNSTYAALSMQYGDSFAKKFGGATGNDPDWFRLSISGYYNGAPLADSVHFYLADYRFANNVLDYIVKDWQWVDLTPLGDVDSLSFTLTSTDNGMYGMNTPPFFCIDNFTTLNSGSGIITNEMNKLVLYPDPASDEVYITIPLNDSQYKLEITDVTGRIILRKTINGGDGCRIDLRKFADGMYFAGLSNNKEIYTSPFVKKSK